MKLIVAFKICPNLDMLQEEDIQITDNIHVDTHFLPHICNCYDESALELALRLAERQRETEPVELCALTAGDISTEMTLKTLGALGYQQTVRVDADPKAIGFHPEQVARTIASYVQSQGQQLVLIGQEAPVGNSGAMAALVSAMTGYPLVCGVLDILSLEGNTLLVEVSCYGGVAQQKLRLPCVLSIGNAVVSKLRVPTLRARMQQKNRLIPSIPLWPENTPVHVVPDFLSLPQRRRAAYTSAFTGKAAVEEILEKSLRERLERI